MVDDPLEGLGSYRVRSVLVPTAPEAPRLDEATGRRIVSHMLENMRARLDHDFAHGPAIDIEARVVPPSELE